MGIATKDKILAVCVAIDDCSAIEIWETKFHQAFLEIPDPRQDIWAEKDHQIMWRAALLFSLIALRKVAEFAENRGTKQDDIKLSDFELDLHTITKHLDTKHSEVIDCALKIKIDKGIAHLTSNLDPDNVELKGLREELKSKNRILQALGDKFFSMIDDYA